MNTNTAATETSVIVLISHGRGTIQAVGATVEAAQAELDGIVGKPAAWVAIYEHDYDGADFKGEAYKALRVPAGEWTGSDADVGRAQEIGEAVGWYDCRERLRIENIRVEGRIGDDYAIRADIDGVDEIEWLDDDGDVVNTLGASHLDVCRRDRFDDDEIYEIHAAFQGFINLMPDDERERLSEKCSALAAERRERNYG